MSYTAEALREKGTFPCIAFWNFNHFVVVDGFKGNHVYLNDPARGQVKVTLDEFDQSFTGIVLVFEKTERFEEGGSKPEMVETIKAAGAENGYFKRWAGYQAKMNEAQVRTTRLNTYLGSVPAALTSLANIAVLVLGIALIVEGDFTPGMLLAFTGFLSSFMSPMNQLVNLGQTVQEMQTQMERIEDVMRYEPDVPEEPADPSDVLGLKREKLRGQVDLEGITFGYSPLDPPLIEDFDLHLEPGQWVALVGGSGCGKSTVAKLVSGLYEPWAGTVKFDEVPLGDVPRAVLRGSLAVVDQDVVIFDGTVKDNVKLWDDSIEDYEVILACRDAGMHDVILGREGGYSSQVLPDGRNFSGGQMQRLEIARVLALPASFFKAYPAGNLANRVASISRLTQTLASLVFGSGLSAVLALVYVVQIGAYTPSLALPSLAIAIVEAGLIVVVTYANMGFERRAMEADTRLSGLVTGLLNGIQKIKLAGAEDRAFAKWAHGYATYAQATYNRPTMLRALPALVTFVSLLGTVIIYYIAGSAGVSYDHYMAFNVAFGQAIGAIMGLAQAAGQFAQIRPTLEIAKPILEAAPEVAEDLPPVTTLAGGVEVSGVSFRYGDDEPYVLKDLSFKVDPGEYVAIVGKSGCGKSTIMRIMLGFEKPERGTVYFGPHDVQKVDLRSLRQYIGVVMQNGRLFMGDIASNITVSAPLATLDDAWEAAEIAGIADDIRKMPMGMQTIVTEGGGGVSGGQRQRLMIARAVCGKREILMLDEATSALDNKTQKHVADSLEALNCTRIVIAHRLSTVRHCDRILVVDDGRIAEEGTYEELIALKGLFAELVARQQLEEI